MRRTAGAGVGAGEGHDCAGAGGRRGATDGQALTREELAILEHVKRVGAISNNECRRLLGTDMHHAWYLLQKLHHAGQLKQEHGRRWARYRLP